MIGNGLQSTLLGVRAGIEEFSVQSMGVIMSMYFVGFLIGARYVPRLISRVGHIRVFAAFASLASSAILFYGLFPNEFVWGLARALTGLSYASLYIVIESWLNNSVDNKGRGKIMALYLFIMYMAMAIGQYLLMVANPAGMELFVLGSVLITVALIPISLSSRPAPKLDETTSQNMSITQLFKKSHLGVFGVFASGMAGACLFSIGPVYAMRMGFELSQISSFMAAAIIGGVLLQFPIGWASDKFDRRFVLIITAAVTAGFCMLGAVFAHVSIYALYVSMFCLGGTGLTIYGLCTAHTNDHLERSQIVAASATMILINGIGSIMGPILSSNLMRFTPNMFFVTMGVIYATIALYGMYRTSVRPSVPMDKQGDFVPTSAPGTGAVIDMINTDDASQDKKDAA